MTDPHEQRRLSDDAPSGEGADHEDGETPERQPPGTTVSSETERSEVEELPFEDAIAELEEIVAELEDGTLALEDAMDRFERGLGLVKVCRAKLEQAELKVEELLESGETTELD